MDYAGRNTGRTTHQIQHAPFGSVYVCVNYAHIAHVKERAHALNREDLSFVDPTFFENDKWRGRICVITIDHACKFTQEQQEAINILRYGVPYFQPGVPSLTHHVEDPNQRLKELLDQAYPE